jgi:anti-sigma-K factor RskA
MSDIHDHSLPEDELIAAEYALGVLAGPERAEAESRVAREPAFARLVAAWEERLTPWAGEIAAVAAPPQLWNRIASALPAQAAQGTSLWQSLAFWRGFALATGALAAACLAALIWLGAATQAPLVAAIDGGGHHHFVATVDARRDTIAVMPAAFAGDVNGRVPELWLIPADGTPRPLGLLHVDRVVTIPVPKELAPLTAKNAVLAVSLEPPGGSTTGKPTGPVIGSGKLTNL